MDFPTNTLGGRPRRSPKKKVATKKPSKWQLTKKTVVTRDGVKRALYKNPAMPGDLRIRRVRTRDGKKTACYIKP
jgi:hypothetical protein